MIQHLCWISARYRTHRNPPAPTLFAVVSVGHEGDEDAGLEPCVTWRRTSWERPYAGRRLWTRAGVPVDPRRVRSSSARGPQIQADVESPFKDAGGDGADSFSKLTAHVAVFAQKCSSAKSFWLVTSAATTIMPGSCSSLLAFASPGVRLRDEDTHPPLTSTRL